MKNFKKDWITSTIGILVLLIGTLSGFGVEPFATKGVEIVQDIQKLPQLYTQGESIVFEGIDFVKVLISWITGFGFFFSKDSRRDSLTKDEKEDVAIMHKYWDINAIKNGLKPKTDK